MGCLKCGSKELNSDRVCVSLRWTFVECGFMRAVSQV